MSKMTSSIHADNLARRRQQAASTAAATSTRQQQKHTHPGHQIETSATETACNGTGANKVLTDFSIDSIIGTSRLAGQSGPATGGPVDARATTCCAPHQDHQDPFTPEYSANRSPMSKMELNLTSHKKHRPKVFRCAWCPLAFSNNGQLRNHERIHTGERPFRCEYSSCGKTFTRNEELTRHKLIHTGFRPHTCSSCDKSFGRKDHLKKHERTHEKKKQRACKRANVSRTLPIRRGGHDLADMFLPVKPDYTAANSHRAAPLPFHVMPAPPATSQPMHFNQPAAGTASPTSFPTSLLTSHIASLAAAVAATATTTATTTSIMPTMNTPASASFMTNTGSPMQQLASNYWQEWCNLLDKQGQQQHFLHSLNRQPN